MTVARMEQEMSSHEFTEWLVCDHLNAEDAANAAAERERADKMTDVAASNLPTRARRRR